MFQRSAPKDEQIQHVELLIKLGDIEGLAAFLADEHSRGAGTKLALDTLVNLDKTEAWDALSLVLQTSAGPVTELVITRLDDIQKPGSTRALGDALSNPSVFVRGAAVRALAKRDAAQTMTYLLRAARDPEKALARLAGRAILRRVEARPAILGELRPQTAEGILDLIDDRWAMELLAPAFPKSIRIMAVRRLGQIGGEESTHALASCVEDRDPEVAEACWKALESCRHVSSFLLLPLLVSSDPKKKARALRVYAKFADELANDLFGGLAKDPDAEVRQAALNALAKTRGVGAVGILEAALDDPEESITSLAIDLLTRIPETENELLRAVFRRQGEIRRRALVALANRGVVTPELVQPYIEFLYKGAGCKDLSQTEYLDSLATVAKTLGQAQDMNAIIALTALGRSVIRRMRRAAIEGLMFYPPLDRADALCCLADTHDADIVKNIAFGLHEIKDERAVLPLIRASIECRGKTMVSAKDALKQYASATEIEFLIGCLTNRWPSVRRYGAEKLRGLKDERAIPALLEASRDTNVEVQLAVFEAMGPFAGKKEDVTKRLLEALSLGDISVRQAVCEALGEAKCAEAIPDLIKSLYNVFLRPRASDALRRIGDRKGVLALRRIERREKLFPKKPKDVLSDKKKSAPAAGHGK